MKAPPKVPIFFSLVIIQHFIRKLLSKPDIEPQEVPQPENADFLVRAEFSFESSFLMKCYIITDIDFFKETAPWPILS